jgi:hypothetical protein
MYVTSISYLVLDKYLIGTLKEMAKLMLLYG